MRFGLIPVATLLLAGALLGSPARAQSADTRVDVELFRPHSDFYGYLHVPGASTLGHLQLGTSLWFHYANDPLVLDNDGVRVSPSALAVTGDDGDGVIDDRFAGNVQVGMGMSRYFSLVVDMPLILHQQGYDLNSLDNPLQPPDPLISAGAGDLRLQPKIVVVDRDRLPVGLALVGTVGLPTGNGGSYLGEEAVTVEPGLVFEVSNGSIHSRDYTIRGALHGAYRVRESAAIRDINVDNEFVYGGAIGFHPADYLEIVGEFHGGVIGAEPALMPAEALGGLKLLLGRYVAINLFGGAGVLSGVGSPDWRVGGSVGVAPSFDPYSRDADKDGVVNALDQCIKEPEDIDSFDDDDGCPDLDNDKDGIPDERDRCPNDAEDDDGFQDEDGCPDVDNDKDSILDIADRCPDEAETLNGYQDEDGCPDSPPVYDTDGDGFPDDIDRCPYDPEDINGVEDEDGCPDEQLRVVVTAQKIQIRDTIYFDYNKATIKPVSFSLLDEVAVVIRDNPQMRVIRVEGHTDSDGSELYNLKLSQSRAESVRAALIERGIEAGRLTAVGFGQQVPIVPNDSEDNKARNRRVEFIIVESD